MFKGRWAYNWGGGYIQGEGRINRKAYVSGSLRYAMLGGNTNSLCVGHASKTNKYYMQTIKQSILHSLLGSPATKRIHVKKEQTGKITEIGQFSRFKETTLRYI